VTLLAFAAERRAAAPLLLRPAAAAINRYRLSVWPTAANPQKRSAASESWDRRTDGRTHNRYADPAPHSMLAVSTTAPVLRESLVLSTGQNKCKTNSVDILSRCQCLRS